MVVLGEDFSGGWFRRLYRQSSPAGPWRGIGVAVALLVAYQILQLTLGTVVMAALFGGSFDNPREMIKAGLVAILPASLMLAALAWLLAGGCGGQAAAVLCLRRPRLTAAGWLVLVAGFILCMYAAILALVTVLGIDLAQYTPGPGGTSPESGSAGLVKEAVFDIVDEPLLFALVLPSIAIGAPLAEELVFRGQLFSALTQTRLGLTGATLVTAALWALLHVSEPWLSIGLIFIMGLALGWLMYRFGSLWVAIACHGGWNLAYALLIFGTAGDMA